MQLWPVYRLQQADLKVLEVGAQLQALKADPHTTEVVAETQGKLQQAEETLRKSSTTLKNLEYDLSAKESLKKQNEKKLYSGKVTNPKELGDMQKEIDVLGQQKGQLEEQVLGMMDTVDQQKAYVSELKYLLNEQQQAVQEGVGKLADERRQLEQQLAEYQQKRGELAAPIDVGILKKYDHLRARKEGVAIARVIRGTCGSCGMALPPQSKSKLQEGQLETCKNCGRMLLGAEGDAETTVRASKGE